MVMWPADAASATDRQQHVVRGSQGMTRWFAILRSVIDRCTMAPQRCAALALGLGLAFSSLAAEAPQPLKVAFVYVGPVGDGGWSYQHNLGRLALEKALGSK